jgi:tRNA threonylcarbamoyladenosine biosynthesis protein TsaE
MKVISGKAWVCKNVEELEAIAHELLRLGNNKRVFAFYGEMGSGKTTLIQQICRHLGVMGPVTSPTFSILHEYQTGKGENVYHFDFYRIKSAAEAFDLGYEDYFYSGNYCLIEWPEKIPGLLPADHAVVEITTTGEERRITLTV